MPKILPNVAGAHPAAGPVASSSASSRANGRSERAGGFDELLTTARRREPARERTGDETADRPARSESPPASSKSSRTSKRDRSENAREAADAKPARSASRDEAAEACPAAVDGAGDEGGAAEPVVKNKDAAADDATAEADAADESATAEESGAVAGQTLLPGADGAGLLAPGDDGASAEHSTADAEAKAGGENETHKDADPEGVPAQAIPVLLDAGALPIQAGAREGSAGQPLTADAGEASAAGIAGLSATAGAASGAVAGATDAPARSAAGDGRPVPETARPGHSENHSSAAANAGVAEAIDPRAGATDTGAAAAGAPHPHAAPDAAASATRALEALAAQQPQPPTGPAASVAQLPAAAPLAPEARFADDNHPNIVAGVRGQLLPSGGTMEIRLDPPELGPLAVTIRLNDGVMEASFETSSDQAAKLLSHSLATLKASLESQGVNVERLHVQQAPKGEQPGQQGGNDRDQQQGQPRDAQQEHAARQEHQRREMMRRMWRKLTGAEDPLDMVA